MNNLEKELKEAESCYSRGDYRNAYQRYLSLAEAGHAESQVFIGWMLLNGIGTTKAPDRASYWFRRGASLGSARGAFFYGRYLTSKGMHEDALAWYRVAATQHDTPALFRVGYSLTRGKGTAVDLEEGYEYLNSAAKKGHVFALREISLQDLKGGRGLLGRVGGPFLFLFSILLGLIVVLRDRFSERLLA